MQVLFYFIFNKITLNKIMQQKYNSYASVF